MPDLWPDRFPPFGALHALVVLVSAGLWVLAIRSARAVRGTSRERTWRRVAAGIVAGFNLAWTIRLLLPAHFELGYSLPFQLCDLAWMACAWSLLCGGDPGRLRHQVPVLWGLALSVLGYLTPAVTSGPGGIHFWTFWISHGQILGTALVNLLAFGVRPDGRGLRFTIVLTTLLCAAATGFNVLAGTSYFFTGDDLPSNPSPLDHLGPWPLRIVWVVLLGIGALVAVAAPFLLTTRRGGGGAGHRSGRIGTGVGPPSGGP